MPDETLICGGDIPEEFAVALPWPNNPVTYHVRSFTPQLPQLVQESIFDRVAREISALCGLRVTRRGRESDIIMSFVKGDHGDGYPLNPGSTLAHAFFPAPGIGGDIHFNDHTAWGNYDLLTIVRHESGHAVGLRHSTDSRSVMYHAVAPGQVKAYTPDDVAGFQNLYGKRVTDVQRRALDRVADIFRRAAQHTEENLRLGSARPFPRDLNGALKYLLRC